MCFIDLVEAPDTTVVVAFASLVGTTRARATSAHSARDTRAFLLRVMSYCSPPSLANP